MFSSIGTFFSGLWIQSSEELLQKSEKHIFEQNVKTKLNNFQVPVGENVFMNTWITESEGPPLVCAHGWGAGAGFFYKQIDDFAKHFKVYVIDWVGFGRSSRPPYSGQTNSDAEDFFLLPFEEWRKQMNLDSFYLLGHSLGGYLSTCYSMRHPSRVRMLILASPGGVPEKPQDEQPSTSGTSSSAAASPQEGDKATPHQLTEGMLTGDGEEPIQSAESELDLATLEQIKKDEEEENKKADALATPPPQSTPVPPAKRPPWQVRLGHALWGTNLATIIRGMGPAGPSLARKWCAKRFGSDVPDYFSEYVYHLIASVGTSGEEATRCIFTVGAWGAAPLVNRVQDLHVPALFLYGRRDWMDWKAGKKCVEDKMPRDAAATSYVVRIDNATHQLFLNNSGDFNKCVVGYILSNGVSLGGIEYSAGGAQTQDS